MEKVNVTTTAACTLLIELTLEEIEMFRARAELAIKNCRPGESILIPFTKSTTLLMKTPVRSHLTTGLLEAAEFETEMDEPITYNS
jgi:hypothetical protein